MVIGDEGGVDLVQFDLCIARPSIASAPPSAFSFLRLATRKRGLSGMNSSEKKKATDGTIMTQNIQRHASNPQARMAVESPALRAKR